MKTTKLVIGIISVVLFLVITFQSCAVGLGNILEENNETSGSAGIFLAFCMLVAGIVAIAARKTKAGGYVAGGFYALGGFVGILSVGSYSDLAVWSVLAFIFAAVMILGSALNKTKKDETEE